MGSLSLLVVEGSPNGKGTKESVSEFLARKLGKDGKVFPAKDVSEIHSLLSEHTEISVMVMKRDFDMGSLEGLDLGNIEEVVFLSPDLIFDPPRGLESFPPNKMNGGITKRDCWHHIRRKIAS